MIVHLVTDRRKLCPGGAWSDCRRCLLRQGEFAIASGVDVMQVREPDLPVLELYGLVRELVGQSRGSATRIFVNDRFDVAVAAGADGIHLPAASPPTSLVRRHSPAGLLIGRSVHSPGEVSQEEGADYLIAGTVWESTSKAAGHPTIGVEGLAAIARAAGCPVLAIGGVTLERASFLREAGAAGAAAIGLFVGAGEPGCGAVPLADTLWALRRSFDTSGSDS